MAYDLPTNGELNWDVKLNASIEAVKATADSGKATADAAIPASEKGAANGVATLGADGKVPAAQLAVEGTAASTTFTPAGNIAATDVQAAIQELDTEKEATGSASSAVATHAAASDPHGDRAYADSVAAFKGCKLDLTTLQSIPSGATTLINFDTELWDVGGWYAPATPSRLTVPAGVTGYVSIVGAWAVYGTTGTYREVQLRKNGAVVSVINFGPTPWGRYLISNVFQVAPGDYFEMGVQHDVGSAVNAETDTFMSIHFLGA